MVTSENNDVHEKTKNFIRRSCGVLKVDHVDWKKASHPDRSYNCIGYVTGNMRRWVHYQRETPGGTILNPEDYWPAGVPENESLEAYMEALETERFKECDPGWEEGVEKIVLYFHETSGGKFFRHVARIVGPEEWESKAGIFSDFRHSPNALDNTVGLDGEPFYGDGRKYMKRKPIAAPDAHTATS